MFRWVIVWALLAMIAINAHRGALVAVGIVFIALLVFVLKRRYSRADAHGFLVLMLAALAASIHSLIAG